MTLLSLSAAAANVLVVSIAQSLLLVVVVTLCLRLLPRISAAARSLIWTAVFALILILPFLATHRAAPSHTITINPIWTVLFAILWLTLTLIRAAQLLLSALTLRHLARSSTPVSNPIPSTSYTLCTSPEIDRPSVVGFFSRRILLPPALYASLTPTELHQVLLHETEHLRRRDDWTNLLQKLALVLIPLNPVLLWVERRLCLERELACDDRVLRATGTPKAYATCLTHLAEHILLRRSLTLALGFLGSIHLLGRQSELTRRVHRILLAPQQTMSPRQTRATTATLLAALTSGTFTLAHAPQVIRFAVPSTQTASFEATAIHTSAPTFQPATFRTSDTSAKATLVKAVVTSQPTQSEPKPAHRIKRVLSRPQLRSNLVRTLQTSWTETQDTQVSPHAQRLVLTTASGAQVSYTIVSTVAVATPHGWIIFQL